MAHRLSANHIAKKLDCEHTSKGFVLRRRVDDGHHMIQQIADIALIKADRRQAFDDMVSLVLIDVFEVEGCGRHTVAAAQETINL